MSWLQEHPNVLWCLLCFRCSCYHFINICNVRAVHSHSHWSHQHSSPSVPSACHRSVQIQAGELHLQTRSLAYTAQIHVQLDHYTTYVFSHRNPNMKSGGRSFRPMTGITTPLLILHNFLIIRSGSSLVISWGLVCFIVVLGVKTEISTWNSNDWLKTLCSRPDSGSRGFWESCRGHCLWSGDRWQHDHPCGSKDAQAWVSLLILCVKSFLQRCIYFTKGSQSYCTIDNCYWILAVIEYLYRS